MKSDTRLCDPNFCFSHFLSSCILLSEGIRLRSICHVYFITSVLKQRAKFLLSLLLLYIFLSLSLFLPDCRFWFLLLCHAHNFINKLLFVSFFVFLFFLGSVRWILSVC